MNWIINDCYIYGTYGTLKFNKCEKISAFDLDHTIIKPSDGKRFSESDIDWGCYCAYF